MLSQILAKIDELKDVIVDSKRVHDLETRNRLLDQEVKHLADRVSDLRVDIVDLKLINDVLGEGIDRALKLNKELKKIRGIVPAEESHLDGA